VTSAPEPGPSPSRAWGVAWGNWLFRHRNWVYPLVLAALFLGFRPRPAGSPAADLLLDATGLAVAVLGQGLRVAVIGFAYIKRGGLNKHVYAERLVTGGFFAHVRNPLYLGNLLILAGLFIIHNNPWVYVLGGLFFVSSYASIVAAEEDFLLRNFGDAYRAYCAGAPRWVPRLRNLGTTLRDTRFDWRRVLVKDYSSCYTWVMTALALLYYEAAAAGQLRAPLPRVKWLIVAAACATAIFLVLRHLKKTKLLRAAA
jgi:protein-S-isoprenylcysteine O-methyltransferase Ste14